MSIVMFVVSGTHEKVNEKSKKINRESLLTAANLFTKEYETIMYWQKEDDTTNTISCLLIDEVIDKGFLENTKVDEEYKKNYKIKVIKSSDSVNSYELVDAQNCKIKDTNPPIVSLSTDKYTSNNNWSGSAVKLTGKATDKETNIVAYQFTETSGTPTNWVTLEVAKKDLEIGYSVTNNGKKEIYFYVKDEGGNVAKQSASIYIDNIAPTHINSTGTLSPTTTPVASYKDDQSGVKTIKYMINTLITAPDANNAQFSEKISFSPQCGTSYYIWSVSSDKVGNISNVNKEGEYYQQCSSSRSSGSSGGGGNSCTGLCKMQQNHDEWHNASAERREELHAENEKIGASLGLTYTSDGVWHNPDGTPALKENVSSKTTSSSGSRTSKTGSGTSKTGSGTSKTGSGTSKTGSGSSKSKK